MHSITPLEIRRTNFTDTKDKYIFTILKNLKKVEMGPYLSQSKFQNNSKSIQIHRCLRHKGIKMQM